MTLPGVRVGPESGAYLMAPLCSEVASASDASTQTSERSPWFCWLVYPGLVA